MNQGGATTYDAPDFARLNAKAEQVVRGRVAEVRSFRTLRAGQPMIETAVRIETVDAVGGDAAQPVVLSLLGGQVGDEVVHVDAMPQFEVGQEVILFVAGNGRNVCPIVGWEHGAYRVRQANGKAAVYRWDGQPLHAVEQVSRELHAGAVSAASADPLSAEQFMAAVRSARAQQADAR